MQNDLYSFHLRPSSFVFLGWGWSLTNHRGRKGSCQGRGSLCQRAAMPSVCAFLGQWETSALLFKADKHQPPSI